MSWKTILALVFSGLVEAPLRYNLVCVFIVHSLMDSVHFIYSFGFGLTRTNINRDWLLHEMVLADREFDLSILLSYLSISIILSCKSCGWMLFRSLETSTEKLGNPRGRRPHCKKELFSPCQSPQRLYIELFWLSSLTISSIEKHKS